MGPIYLLNIYIVISLIYNFKNEGENQDEKNFSVHIYFYNIDGDDDGYRIYTSQR